MFLETDQDNPAFLPFFQTGKAWVISRFVTGIDQYIISDKSVINYISKVLGVK
jgi:hypothetical protein